MHNTQARGFYASIGVYSNSQIPAISRFDPPRSAVRTLAGPPSPSAGGVHYPATGEVAAIENSKQDEKSRSQIKREFRALKELGIQLTDLSKGQLRAIPLSDEMRDALLAAKGMTRRALQRQQRHLISLLAEEDVDTIRAALTGTLQPHADKVVALHEAEDWRDRLLSADQGQLAALVERYPECDRTHVGQLVRNAKREGERDKPPKSARQLFRYLRQLSEQQD